jgi:protein phosphatase
MATFVWPWMYVVQIGDSRCYAFSDGRLTQVTRDQTLAQDLVDKGVLPKERAASSPFSHVLASAIGGQAATPEVTRLDISRRGTVLLLCSDGLTKHVSDAQIAAELGRLTSAEQVCRTLLQMALDGGGSDNVTVLAGRAARHDS